MRDLHHEDTYLERHYEIFEDGTYFRQPRGTAEDKWQAIIWHRSGVSKAEIARRLGFHKTTILEWLRYER